MTSPEWNWENSQATRLLCYNFDVEEIIGTWYEVAIHYCMLLCWYLTSKTTQAEKGDYV